MNKISAVYKITNELTVDFYIGSSVDVYKRWRHHKYQSTWNTKPNSKLYKDMQDYGVDKFKFEIIVSIMPECLKQVEQDCIEFMNPTYNDRNAKGYDTERRKENNHVYTKTYLSQICNYNGETLTLNALKSRFQRAGISKAYSEAKKYLIQE